MPVSLSTKGLRLSVATCGGNPGGVSFVIFLSILLPIHRPAPTPPPSDELMECALEKMCLGGLNAP